MKKVKNNLTWLIILLLLITFIKEIIFSIAVPVWQTPDEQAHFAQVAYYSELGKMPLTGNDLNREIYQSEVLLGTLRDSNGNNKFTFHPEYRIDYSKTQTGLYENIINNYPLNYRTEFVKQEAADYPPLYYIVSSWFYKLFYSSGLIIRVYAVRFLSIALGVALVWLAYLIGREIFPEDKLMQITLPVFVSFQPMITFVSSGINSDNLMNVLFAAFIYLSILIVKKRVNLNLILLLILNFWLLYLTKPQFIYTVPVFLMAVVLSFKQKKKLLVSLGLIILLGMLFLIFEKSLAPLLKNSTYLYSFGPGDRGVINLSPLQYIKNALVHTYAEVLPWYWGVFDWLGVTLPRGVSRVINYTVVLAGFGFLIEIARMTKRRFSRPEDRLIIFMFLVAVIYFAGISYYDYLFILGHGFSFGIQGRYFFPTVIPQMLILIVGLRSLMPDRFKDIPLKIFGLLIIVLNLIALNLIAHIYYDTSNITAFINQASQYKIAIFKGVWLEFLVVIYLVSLLVFIVSYLRVENVRPAGKRSGKIAV